MDTFDPKPALATYAGQPLPETLITERKTGAAFPSPFQFQKYGQSGIEVSELFAETARHIDDIAVIRSMYAQVPNHEPSLMLMNCGNSVQSRPSVGSWALYGLGTENQNLPGFIAMCPGGYPIKGIENWQAGFLPGAYQGTYIDSRHERPDRLVENIDHPHATTAAQRRQLDLLATLNADHRQGRPDDRLEARIQSFELAFRMQMEAAEAFDVSREPANIRELYGPGVHGRQTLIARRLVERGVRYVQLWHGAGQPWDNHNQIEANHRKLAAEIDRPIAALLTDLKARGLLDETLVLWGGEFGRTPTVELGGDGKPMNGRDHNHYGFSVWMAGGGIKGGTVYGSTDEFGFRAQERPGQRPRPARHDPAPPRLRPRAADLSLRRAGLPPHRRSRKGPARHRRLTVRGRSHPGGAEGSAQGWNRVRSCSPSPIRKCTPVTRPWSSLRKVKRPSVNGMSNSVSEIGSSASGWGRKGNRTVRWSPSRAIVTFGALGLLPRRYSPAYWSRISAGSFTTGGRARSSAVGAGRSGSSIEPDVAIPYRVVVILEGDRAAAAPILRTGAT